MKLIGEQPKDNKPHSTAKTGHDASLAKLKPNMKKLAGTRGTKSGNNSKPHLRLVDALVPFSEEKDAPITEWATDDLTKSYSNKR